MQIPLPFFLAALISLTAAVSPPGAALPVLAAPARQQSVRLPPTPSRYDYRFHAVRVLDHRPDSGRVMIRENGKLPLHTVALSGDDVSRYLNRCIGPHARQDMDLLIDLRRLSIPNDHRLGTMLFLEADVYARTPDSGFQLLLHFAQSFEGEGMKRFVIAHALDTMLHYCNVALAFPLAGAGPAPRNYTAWGLADTVQGIFTSFDDFRAGVVASWRIVLHPSGAVYRGNTNDNWGVSDGRNCYIRYQGNMYLPLLRDSAGFHFWVPPPLPDAYSLLSSMQMPQGKARYLPDADTPGPDLSGASSLKEAGLLLGVYIAVFCVYDGVYALTRIRPKKHPGRTDYGYRYCTIDMETGDIRYAQHAYPR